MPGLRIALSCFLLIVAPQLAVSQNNEYTRLAEGFHNPPATARPKAYWWCLNGNIDTLRAKEEFLAMKRAGINGFDIFEIGVPESDTMIAPGPAFMSDESLRNIKTVVDEAGRLGMTVGLNLSSSWNAGGSWVRPGNAGKSLYYSKISLKGVKGKAEEKLPFPEIRFPKSQLVGGSGKSLILFKDDRRPEYYEEVAVLAIPAAISKGSLDTSMVINLEHYFDKTSDLLRWEAPAGDWDIYRFVCSNSGQQLVMPSTKSAGLTIDHFDSVAVETHLMFIINRLRPVLGDFRHTALKSFYLASYEARGFVWTSSLCNEFKKLNGYDITKFLPSFFDKYQFPEAIVEKVNRDFRKTLSYLMINNLYKKARDICNKYGLKINCEAGGPGYPLYNGPSEPLKALGTLDIPRGEFWVNHSRYYWDDKINDSIDILRVVKEVSAASHTYEKGISEEESFTSFLHWQEGPGSIKNVGDRAFCEGMNKVVLHGFSHNIQGSGFPGYVYHAGTHFNDKRVWWPMAKPFFDYLSRISFIAQESQFIADVVWFYGSKVPNSATPKNTHFRIGPGYDYEVINADILVNKLTSGNGKLFLPDGASFSLLAVEKERQIDPFAEQAIKKLSASGAIITGTDPREIKKNLNVGPDFAYRDDTTTLLDYIHYRKGDLDFYFVRNTSDEWISRRCGFRQQHKVPEIWDPVSGDIIPVRIYDNGDQCIQIPLTLAPNASFFVVFRSSMLPVKKLEIPATSVDPPLLQYISEGVILPDPEVSNPDKYIAGGGKSRSIHRIDGPWKVSFISPVCQEMHYVMSDLVSWTLLPYDDLKYFSGIAVYERNFEFRTVKHRISDKKVFLDLGSIAQVGEVWLNEQYLGIVWTRPYRFDVTDLLINGTNTLRIKVANTWCNRIIGDAITGTKHTNTNITRTTIPGFDKVDFPWKEVPLLNSGLLGPVTLETLDILR